MPIALVGGKSGAGIYQFASGSAGSVASIVNDGSLNVSAVAYATGTASANANAIALGAIQTVPGGTASFVNGSAGTFAVTASANASAQRDRQRQRYGGRPVAASERRTCIVRQCRPVRCERPCVATGSSAIAHANAVGYNAFGDEVGFSLKSGTGQSFEMDWTNQSGATFEVSASATAAARPMRARSASTLRCSVDHRLCDGTQQAALSGSIVNDGTFNVLAHASASGTSGAVATGIVLISGVNTLTVTNTGTFNVEAMTAAGGPATATGIVVPGNGTGIAADGRRSADSARQRG